MNEREAKIAIIQRMLWDYNILPEDCLDVLEGKRNQAGHYKEELLFKKLLESFPWYTIMGLLPLPRIKALLTESLIHTLRNQRLIMRYGFIRIRLSTPALKCRAIMCHPGGLRMWGASYPRGSRNAPPWVI